MSAGNGSASGGSAVSSRPCWWTCSAALRFGDQGRFHPLKYISGLARAIERLGGKIYCGNRVNDVTGGDPEQHELCRAQTDSGPAVSAKAIVVATNTPAPINDWAGIYTKQASYRTYIVGMRIPKGSVTDALYWDTLDPYHYVRIDASAGDASHDILIIGGEDHKTGQVADTEECFARLGQTLVEIIPEARITHRWSGQVIETNDGLPYIGQTAERQFVATGFAGNGMTFGTVGAMMACDAVLGRESPWQDLFSVSRKKLRGGAWDESVDALLNS